MVTFPAGMAPQEREFMARQRQLQDRLRFLDPRSRRAKELRSELVKITMAELAREVPPKPIAKPTPAPWWQQ